MNTKKQVTVLTEYRALVSEQYKLVCTKTMEFFREVVKFGAILNQVEEYLGESRGRTHEGEGLKAWMEENCPEVNYNTAQSYKYMASKVAKMIGGGAQALACLQGRNTVNEPGTQNVIEIDSTFIEKRDALFEKVESRRQLEQMWFEFCGATRRPGRPIGTGSGEYRRKSSLECAIEAVWPTVQHLLKHRGEMFTAYKLLPDEKLSEMRATLAEHVQAIDAELKVRS